MTKKDRQNFSRENYQFYPKMAQNRKKFRKKILARDPRLGRLPRGPHRLSTSLVLQFQTPNVSASVTKVSKCAKNQRKRRNPNPHPISSGYAHENTRYREGNTYVNILGSIYA